MRRLGTYEREVVVLDWHGEAWRWVEQWLRSEALKDNPD